MYENFLEKAVLLGDLDAAKHLLSLEGVDPNYHSSFHCSMLELATYCRRSEIVDILLAHGANPNPYQKLNTNDNPQMKCSEIQSHDDELFNYYHQGTEPTTNIDYEICESLLILKFDVHNSEIVSALLVDNVVKNQNPSPAPSINTNDHRETQGHGYEILNYHPLTIAASNMDYEICELLLNKGADVNAVSMDFNDIALTALHLTCAHPNDHQHHGIINKLLECGANVNARTSDSSNNLTPLHIATVAKNSDMIKILLKHGANPNMKTCVNSSEEDEQKTALELAFCASSVDLYDILLPITDRVNLNHIMVQLVYNKNSNGVKKLLEFGLDPDGSYSSDDDINLLHMAANTGSNDVVGTLIKFNANVNIPSFSEMGVTPLHRACAMGYLDVVKTLIEVGHATVDVFDNSGFTPLHCACCNGYIDITNTLIASNASVNITSLKMCKGLTPLHLACSEGHFEVVKTLLKHGSLPNLPVHQTKETPLYSACVKGNTDIIKILLHYGADLTVKNSIGLTAIQCSKDKKVKVKVEAIIQDFLSSNTNQKPQETPDQVDIRNRIAEHPKEAVCLEKKANQQPPLAEPSKSCIFKPFDT